MSDQCQDRLSGGSKIRAEFQGQRSRYVCWGCGRQEQSEVFSSSPEGVRPGKMVEAQVPELGHHERARLTNTM